MLAIAPRVRDYSGGFFKSWNHQRVAGDAPESRLRGELGADFPEKLKPHPGSRPGAVLVLSLGGEGPKQGGATSANERSE